jgi:hypothetical protein
VIFFIFFSFLGVAVGAPAPAPWEHVIAFADRHEFYRNDEPVTKPRDAWQTLFSLVYLDRELARLKDCVFYRVPGADAGVVKVRTIPAADHCDDYVLPDAGLKIDDVRSLRFTVSERGAGVEFTRGERERVRWEASFSGAFKRPLPAPGLSSADFKAPPLIFLAPAAPGVPRKLAPFVKNDVLCHDVNDDCVEVSPSTCGDCDGGWYEIPNGCPIGPRYCGTLRCGGKNEPACRRGLRWQRKASEFDCRTDSSFAYCATGASVQCEGRKAYCR